MAIVQYLSSSQITPITGYNYIAELQYGSNGEMYGPPELDAGTATSRKTKVVTWDGYPEDGIDTGWLGSGFGLKSGTAGLVWETLASGSALTYNVGTLSRISSITIRAAVQNQVAMLWRNAEVRFYNGATLREVVPLADFGADKEATPGGGIAEQLVLIQPAFSDSNRVTVGGEFKILSPAGVWLDSYDAFSQIFAFTGSGSGGSMLSGASSSLLEAEPMTGAQSGVLPTGDVFATAPLSSDELLEIETAPDVFQSDDPALL